MSKPRILAALGMAAALMIGAGVAEAASVKFGVAAEPYPPFSVKDAAGKWTGWEIEIGHAVCKAAKLECEFKEVAWDGIIASLNSKKIDVIWSSMSITPERKKAIDFTDKYYNTPANVIGAKAQAMTATGEGLKGKIIGVQVSTIHQRYAEKYFKPTAKEIKVYQTQDEANQDLAAGRVDAILADSITLDDFLKTDPGKCCDVKGAVKDDPEILGAGVGGGVRKKDGDLKAKLNAGIAAVRASGEYDTITKKYFTFDIYGSK